MVGLKDIVTIDGPSGVGKSTVSRLLAGRLRYTYLDTGAMYRAVAYRCREMNVHVEDDEQLRALLGDMQMALLPPLSGGEDVRVLVDGRELGQALRTREMGLLASRISALPLVRRTLTDLQRRIGADGQVVAEGRDTGTVVFPDARWKFYLDASPEIRAARRAAQLRAKGEGIDEAALLAEIIKRDREDRERTLAPLKAAPDAIHIDSSAQPAEAVVALMYACVMRVSA